MTRSQQGLRGAGEWWLLKQMMPDFQGQRVLDLGCGYGWLRTGSTLVMSFEHPLFTANGSDWIYDEAGHKLHFPLDHYFQEGKREAFFLAERITKYHRTLTTYLNTLLQLGFVLDQIIEPYPNEEMLEWEGMKDELRRPMMLMIAAHKH